MPAEGKGSDGMTTSHPGLYVHVPFCVTKCPYCAFRSTTALDRVPQWLKAIEAEASSYRDRFGGGAFDSLYVGGGTPSALPAEALDRLVCILRGVFPLEAGLEATIEVNPGDVDRDRAGRLRDLGFNRVSVGVQSFLAPELALLGRRHDVAQAETALWALREAGFTNLGIDLIQGLPGQSLAARLVSLERALAFRPEHLSCYELSFEDGTLFGKARIQGTLAPPPDEDAAAEGFLATSAFLESHGYVHYEVSNFARGEEHRSRHNGKYWRHVPYLGLGPSAHSFDGERRWWNVPAVEEYCRRLAAGDEAVEERETLNSDQSRLERLALGFRTREGVAGEDLDGSPEALSLLARLEAEGLVTVGAGRVSPTREGLRISDALAREFSGAPNPQPCRRRHVERAVRQSGNQTQAS